MLFKVLTYKMFSLLPVLFSTSHGIFYLLFNVLNKEKLTFVYLQFIDEYRRTERKRNYGLPYLSLSVYIIIASRSGWLNQGLND